MSMKTDFLGGDLYTTFILGSLVEAPITFSVYFLLEYVHLINMTYKIYSFNSFRNLVASEESQ